MDHQLEQLLRQHFDAFSPNDETEALFASILANLNEEARQKTKKGLPTEQILAEAQHSLTDVDDLLVALSNRCRDKVFDTHQLGRFYDRFFAAKCVHSLHCDVSQLNQIIIDYRLTTVVVSTSLDDELVVNEYMNHDRKSLYVQKQQDGDKLKLEQKTRGGALAFMKIRVEILIPQSFTGFVYLNTRSGNTIISHLLGNYILEVSSTSGALVGHDLSLSQIHLQSKSGSIKAGELKADQIVMSSTSGAIRCQHAFSPIRTGMISVTARSGNVDLTHLKASELNAETHSGSLSATGLEAAQYHFSAKSGNLVATHLQGSGQFGTTSGNLNLDFDSIDANLIVNSTSGSITVKTPASSEYRINTHSASGNIVLPFSARVDPSQRQHFKLGQLGEAPTFELSAHTQSGNIRLTTETMAD